jgi:hypothetical protein
MMAMCFCILQSQRLREFNDVYFRELGLILWLQWTMRYEVPQNFSKEHSSTQLW